MKIMRLISMLFCLSFLLLFSCNEIKPDGEKAVREFVEQWNDNHEQLKSAYLQDYYMDVVTYYGKERTKAQVQQDKTLLFEKFPDYEQRIDKDQMVIIKESGSFLVTFTKHVTYNGIKADYTAFLSLISKNRKFKILREGIAENSETMDAPIFPSYRENDASIIKNRRLFGDFNGDGLSDYATVQSPIVQTGTTANANNSAVPCEGDCVSTITFSDASLKPIRVEGAYQSQLENLKDLNEDRADEIGFWDIKPTTKSLYIFDATTGKLLTKPLVINTKIHRNLKLIDVFKKTGPKKITVSHSELVNGNWILKSEIVRLD